MDITELITSGGDERIKLKSNGKNKYFVNPADYKDFVTRSSCTCSPLNQDTEKVVERLVKGLSTDKYKKTRKQQVTRLKRLINYRSNDKFDFFYAPSGSDLSYYPLIFSRLLAKDKDVVSLVTRPEELGKGSIAASKGLYFGEQNQFGEPLSKGEAIDPKLNIEYISFTSISPSGLVYDHKDELIAQIEKIPEDKFLICSLVIGSKTGTIDNIDLIKEVKRDILWIVDICQFRVSRRLINQLLDLGCLVMITGSKFYQAPPFCGGMLVPKSLSEKFNKENAEAVSCFSKIFTQYDIPENLPWLAEQFSDVQNMGLLARWEAALYEMEQLNTLKVHAILKHARLWNRSILSELNKYPDVFDILPETNRTNWSIISFQIKDKNGNAVTGDALESFYQELIKTEIEELGNKKALIGQPVHLGDNSYLRIALGSYNLRTLISHPFESDQDAAIVAHIANLSKQL